METPEGYLRLQVGSEEDAAMLAKACRATVGGVGGAIAEGNTVLLWEQHYSDIATYVEGSWERLYDHLEPMPVMPEWTVLRT